MVDRRPRPQRRQHAERHGQQERDEQCGAGQLQRGRQAAAHVERDRLPGRERLAEVPGRDLAEIPEQLHRDRPVESHAVPQRLDVGASGAGAGGEVHRGVAGQHAHEREGDDDHAEQRRDGREQATADAPEDAGQHGVRPA